MIICSAASTTVISLILELSAVSGILALLNLIPLSCSISKKFFSHLDRMFTSTTSSQSLVSRTTSLSSNFNFALMGSSLPRKSYKPALLETIMRRVKDFGTNSSILARLPPFSKKSTPVTLPRHLVPKWRGGIFTSTASTDVIHRIPFTSIEVPSTVSSGCGSSPENENPFVGTFSRFKTSVVCFATSKASSLDTLESMRLSTYLPLVRSFETSGFSSFT